MNLKAIQVSVDATVVILVIAGTGAFLTRKQILTKEGAACISGLTINCFLPCLLFAKLMSNLNIEDLVDFALIIIACVLHIALGAFFGSVVCLLMRSRNEMKIAMTSIGFNSLPIVIVFSQVLKGTAGIDSDGESYALFFYCVMSFFKWTVAYSMMEPRREEPNTQRLLRNLKEDERIKESEETESIKESELKEESELQEESRDRDNKELKRSGGLWWKLKKSINPPMISTFVAIPLALIPYMSEYVCSGSGAVLRENVFEAVSRLGNIAPTVIILYLGSRLSHGYPPTANIKTSTVALIIACKLVLMPLVGFPLFYALYYGGVVSKTFVIIMVLSFSTPTSLQLMMICAAHKTQEDNLAKIALIMYLVSPFTLSFISTILLIIFS